MQYKCKQVIICVTGMKMGLRKRQRGSDALIVFGVLAQMPADAQMNDSGFPAGRSEQTIMTP